MELDAKGDPPMPAYQKILEEEHARINHVIDVLSICHHAIAIGINVVAR